ncbi:hypothetical protein [Nocardioides daphniae]|uniref:Uncharacterized protein n=1 Tax=Nocardioides daphniae TaxID=402297 RepID=A0ABQ1QL34_9ACTN|nr:hypothetical protein [Nocardioides daphniae]GGD29521.1 hypothetical protein GCM10007231_31240 [Nocardioides daphniae]
MAALSRLRTTTAYVVWWLCVLLALLLAGACLLVALKADPGSPWGWWLRAADAVTFGWFARPDAGVVGGADVRATVLRWGSAAGAVLLTGGLVQWLVRPRG